jgi:hypothetical protein
MSVAMGSSSVNLEPPPVRSLETVPGRLGGWSSRFSHDVGLWTEKFSRARNSASILASRRGSSTGLVS